MKRAEILRICQAIQASPLWEMEQYPDSEEVPFIRIKQWCGHPGHGAGHTIVTSWEDWLRMSNFNILCSRHPLSKKRTSDD
jgi:hypothetical protein